MAEEKRAFRISKKLNFVVKEDFAAPVALDNTNIIVSSKTSTYQFNTAKCTLSKLFEYSHTFVDHSVTICGNKIHIGSWSDRDRILSYRIKNKSIQRSNNPNYEQYGILCSLNNTLHLVSGAHYQTFDPDKNEWSKILHKFSWIVLQGHALLGLETKKQLILLGGCSGVFYGGYSNEIWICDTIPKMLWKKLSITLPHKMYYFGSVLFKDDKYLAIFGGYIENDYSNEIWILDLTSFVWIKSPVKCPLKAYFYAVRLSKNIYLFEMNKPRCWVCTVDTLLPFNANKVNIKSTNNTIDKTLIRTLQIDLENEKKKVVLTKQQIEQLLKDKYENEKTINEQQVLLSNMKQTNEEVQSELSALKTQLIASKKENINLKMKLEQTTKQYASKFENVNKLNVEMQNNLLNVNEEYKEMSIKYNELLKQQQDRIINDKRNYKQWDYNNITDWICNLSNKKFQKYEKELRLRLKEEGIKGNHIGELDKNDLHRLGIKDFSDKKELLKRIQEMIRQNNQNDENYNNVMNYHNDEGIQTPYL